MIRFKKSEGLGHRPALRWFLNIAIVLVWVIGIGLIPLYFTAVNYGRELLISYLTRPLLFVLNVLPGLLIALLLLGITNRMWPAVLGSGVIVIGASVVHYFKMQTRTEPLMATDIRYMTEAASISSRYTLTVSPVMILSAAAIVIAVVFAIVCLKARFRSGKLRLLFLAAVIVLCTGIYIGVYRSADIFNLTENTDVVLSNGRRLSRWSETDRYCSRGFWYPFLYSTTEFGAHKPEGYSEAEAEALLAAYSGEDLSETRKVNVISVMLEAYADFSVYESLDFSADPYRFFHELQAESISGQLDTNIFAGGTIDTERCYMTGTTEAYGYRGAAQSFIRWFSAQGYETEFCHPGYTWFYNRQNVSEYLGFDRSYFGDDTYLIRETGEIMADADFFPRIVEQYRAAAADGSPYFNMSVTYQNHGPYDTDKLSEGASEYIRQNGLSDESYYIFNNYFSGIAETDAALEAFVDTMRSEEAPVVLVIFGDHKPWLGDNSSAYAEAGIDLRSMTEESYYTYCQAPYVIWANDAAKAALGKDFRGDGGDFSPCYLMMKLFDACGFSGDAYINAQREICAAADIVSPALSHYRSGGILYEKFEDLPETAQEKIQDLLILSYYRADHKLK